MIINAKLPFPVQVDDDCLDGVVHLR